MEIHLPGILECVEKDIYTRSFPAVLFPKRQDTTQYPPIRDWLHKLWCIHAMQPQKNKHGSLCVCVFVYM